MKNENTVKLHDRINRVIGVSNIYRDSKVRLEISDDLLHTYNGQVMLITAANMLSRWCGSLTLSFSLDTECVIKKHIGLPLYKVVCDSMLVHEEGTNIDFNVPDDGSNMVLYIGNPNPVDQRKLVWINSDGWIAACGTTQTQNIMPFSRSFVCSATFASCLGVCEIFRKAIGQNSNEFVQYYSLHNYAVNSSLDGLANPFKENMNIDLGSVHQIGCGAIGSSFAYLLSLTDNLSAKISFIDFDETDKPNLCSSLLFQDQDAKNFLPKVNLCADVSASGKISTEPFKEEYGDFISKGFYTTIPPDIVLCFANDHDIWSTIQHNYPPLTFHATTNKSWGTNFGRHIPEVEWCLMCRFQSEISANYKPACSVGNVSAIPEKETLGILPFLAPASALITLSQLYKLNDTDFVSTPNFIEFSMRNHNGNFVEFNNPAKLCYVCKDQRKEYYPDLIQNSRFWNLSKK